MLAEAVHRAATAGIVAEFAQMDAQRLELPDAQFDGVRAERLLQHVPVPDAALRELVRVAKPGGRIVIWEADLDLFVLDAPDYQTSRVMQRFICDSFRHGGIGHKLYRCFKHLLTNVQATPLIHAVTDLAVVESAFDLDTMTQRAVAAGVIAKPRATNWLASLANACDAGCFFCAIGGVLASGRKPS
jgi:SAM-dependent methyltransferase